MSAANETARLATELTHHEVATAMVEWLVRNRGWPSGVRYDNTVFEPALGRLLNRFSADVSQVLSESKKGGG